MPKRTSNGIGLPKYQRNQEQRRWVASKRRTANLIQSLWNAADAKRRVDPDFLCLLVKCGWTNMRYGDESREATRRWRNRNIAEYLGVAPSSDDELAPILSSQFKALSLSQSRSLLRSQTGITLYYTAFRPGTLDFVRKHAPSLALAFRQISSTVKHPHSNVLAVARQIEELGSIHTAGRSVSPFNGLTPTLACLDPQRRFPIMNDRTASLLRYRDMKPDAEGVADLSKLISPRFGLKDSFELDAYAYGQKFPKPKVALPKIKAGATFSDVGLKSEIASTAQLTAKKAIIRKRHNSLTNRLFHFFEWRQKTLKQSRFDALVIGWKNGRNLLIEAKTAWEGPSGRSQVRQAIGQLFDYRFTYMPDGHVDLAILLPTEPSSTLKQFLSSLHIEVLWFKGKQLMGTIQL